MPDTAPPPSKERFRRNPDDADALEVPKIAASRLTGKERRLTHELLPSAAPRYLAAAALRAVMRQAFREGDRACGDDGASRSLAGGRCGAGHSAEITRAIIAARGRTMEVLRAAAGDRGSGAGVDGGGDEDSNGGGGGLPASLSFPTRRPTCATLDPPPPHPAPPPLEATCALPLHATHNYPKLMM